MSTQTPSQDSPQDHPDVAAPALDLPAAAVEAFNQANAHFKAGRWEQARAGYELALQHPERVGEALALADSRGRRMGELRCRCAGFDQGDERRVRGVRVRKPGGSHGSAHFPSDGRRCGHALAVCVYSFESLNY